MPKMRSLLIGVPVALLVGSIISFPTFAIEDSNNSQSISNSTESEDNSQSESRSVESEDNSRKNEPSFVREQLAYEDDDKETDSPLRAKIRTEAQNEIAQLKSKQKTARSSEDRKKACEARLNGMEIRFTKLTEATKHYLVKADDINDKLVDYKNTSRANVSNWQELQDAIVAAQTKASSSVDEVAALKPTVDCTKETVISDIAGFKKAVETAREDLKAYRAALKNMIVALNTNQPKENEVKPEETN